MMTDTKHPSYDEIRKWIRTAPRTWLSGLLKETIQSCVRKDVFNGNSDLAFYCLYYADSIKPSGTPANVED